MEEKKYDFGNKSEEYPHGYGYCQCGCGELALRLSNGMYLRFIGRHKILKVDSNKYNTETMQVRREKRNNRIKEQSAFYSKYVSKKWSKKYDQCVGCSTTLIPHRAKGYCKNCYAKYVVRRTGYFDRDNIEVYSAHLKKMKPKISARNKIQRNLPVSIRQRLTPDLLTDLYHNKLMSFGDIAKMFDCSRVYIFRLCLEYGVRVKGKSEARKDASFTKENIRYHSVNKDFFKTWSCEMAYVLGFFCADGNIPHTLDCITFDQKEREILEKVKKLMQAEHIIKHYKHQDIHSLQIGSKEIVNDLLQLGITPRKSLTIKFPNVPKEFLNHFIRGNFDGDGSICRQGSGWKVVFLSGSKDFVEGIKENIEKFGQLGEAKLYKHKDANAYTCSYHSKDNITKIFNFFYDGYTIKNELYLARKYNLFKEAINGFNKTRDASGVLIN